MRHVRQCVVIVPLAILLATSAFANTAPRIFWRSATFELKNGLWTCVGLPAEANRGLFADLRLGDAITVIGQRDVRKLALLPFLYTLREVDVGIADQATVLRSGREVKLTTTNLRSGPNATITTAQDSPVVLRSNIVQIQPGDTIISYGSKEWSRFAADFAHGTMPMVQWNLDPGTVVAFRRRAVESKITIPGPLSATFLLLPNYAEGEETILDAKVLHGLNVPDVTLNSLRGNWTLFHFWATWCAPCIKMTPTISNLSTQKGLRVVPIGFSDSPEKLKEYAEKERLPAAYSPDPALASKLGIEGIPFDILFDAAGEPAVVFASISETEFRKVVLDYVDGSR